MSAKIIRFPPEIVAGPDPATEFVVRLDDETVAWLMDVAGECGMPPSDIIAAIIRDIREDDEEAHRGDEPPLPMN